MKKKPLPKQQASSAVIPTTVSQKPVNSPPRSESSVEECLARTRASVDRATAETEKTVILCLIAGQRLNEAKERLPHGSFSNWRNEFFGTKSERFLQDLMRAAFTVLNSRHLSSFSFNNVADILESREEDLQPDEVKFRTIWFSLVRDQTIKSVIQGNFLEDRDPLGMQRALNGKLNGGTNEDDDRTDYPVHLANQLKKTSSHLSHWGKMGELQKSEVTRVFEAAVFGNPVQMNRAGNVVIQYKHAWPAELCDLMVSICRKRSRILKGN